MAIRTFSDFSDSSVSGTQNGAYASPRSSPVPTSPDSSGETFSCPTCRDTWLVEVDTPNGGGHWEPCPDCDGPNGSDSSFSARLAASPGPAATDPPGSPVAPDLSSTDSGPSTGAALPAPAFSLFSALHRELSGVPSPAELAVALRFSLLRGGLL